MNHDRRSILAALGVAALPLGLAARASVADAPSAELQFRSFEEAIREAFRPPLRGGAAVRRLEVGHCDLVRSGLPGCVNDRPFAGFAVGQLRIVRAGSEPGPEVGGVRLYVFTVDVALTADRPSGDPGRPLDFSTIPPAPVLVEVKSEPAEIGLLARRKAGR